MAAAVGNQAFSKLVVARAPDTAAPAQAATTTWNVPDWGLATQTLQARSGCSFLESRGRELLNAGFNEFELLVTEARDWNAALGPGLRPLTADEARQLSGFGSDFKAAHDKAIRQIAEALVKQLTSWLNTKPISDEDLFELRETIHHQFVRAVDTDVLARTVALVDTAENFVGEVEKWSGRAAKAKHVFEGAKRLEDVHKGIKEISDQVGEVKKLLHLAQDLGRMTGALGRTPAGVDDIGAMEAALDVMDFAVSKIEVPGFSQLWSGYILKVSKICLQQLRAIKEQLYKGDRQGGVRLFFMEHRGDDVAPDIRQAFFHGVDSGQHFPGGQPMLDFMWRLMRAPDAITSVPAGIEDFFVTWRDEMNAGVAEKLESDDSITNLWNVFSRERAPNIVPWLKGHRQEAWVKLYGGMPAPTGG
jgi:hypothetical protein